MRIEPPTVALTEPPPEEFVAGRRACFPNPSSLKKPRRALAAGPPLEPEPSLGATLLANGLVTRPKIPANDPHAGADQSRMTQAEKIAFFS